MLKVSPWKGELRLRKQGKLNLSYVGPSKAMEKVGSIAYKLELPLELNRVHNMFYVSNFKKYYADEPLVISKSRVPIGKVRWNSKRGPEFMWEREDQFKKKYLHIFTKTASWSSAASLALRTRIV
ncbi:hypothetical protein Tco_1197826 [Tanacetum coccineum]